ncbi:MAG: ISAs1 family transposase [Treponema sp.]|nr:ISAs1 family transposase [Treponema sp.]
MKDYCEARDFAAPLGKNRDMQFHAGSTHAEQHGRIADRDYGVRDDEQWFIERHPDWKSIRSIGVAASRREVKGPIRIERRHFISNLPADAAVFARAVRGHWGIENSLH